MLRDTYAVEEAEDGRAALNELAKGPFSVVITDLVMPDIEGIELLREIRRLYPSTKTIAMSGALQNAVYLTVASRIGAHATLAKPFDVDTLRAVLRQLEV